MVGSLLGNWLEFGVHTTDIIESLRFYRQLGFVELEVRDTWPYKYAVVTDGELFIGLHDLPAAAGPSLNFVHQNLAREARAMADHGFQFEALRLDEDVFNELSFRCRNDHLVRVIEARTYSGPYEDTNDSVLGRFFELTLPVRDAIRAGSFWAPLAPELLRVREKPLMHMRFNAAGLPLGLSESTSLSGPSLCFRCDDPEAVWISLARHSIAHRERPGFEGAFISIKAPEGTELFLFDEDFLGAMYEVEEGGELPPG